MNFLDLAKRRYSVRSYEEKKVEEEKVLKILEAARVAPTGANKQPCHILAVSEKENLESLSKAANFFGAPLVFVICSDPGKAWFRSYDGKNISDIDASIVTCHMMLEAADLDLGTLWICKFRPDIVKKDFNLPENLEPVNILAVGYAAGEAAGADRHGITRKPLSEIVTYEKF